MSASSNRNLGEVFPRGKAGIVWNLLHSEREEICEALLKDSLSLPALGAGAPTVSRTDRSAANWHRELLQARLRKIDEAMDSLMSGSYGNCRECGKWIEDQKLDLDPAIAFCAECWKRKQKEARTAELTTGAAGVTETPEAANPDGFVDKTMADSPLAGLPLEALTPFDTILVRTLNSEYRILLLNPNTGRSLVDGLNQFAGPVDAVVYGSTYGGTTFKVGFIGVGLRLEMWVKDKLVSTSPVQSIRVEHQRLENFSNALSCLSL